MGALAQRRMGRHNGLSCMESVLCGRIFRICWTEIICQSKNPCSECKCDQYLLLKHQNMLIPLCCRWFSFCVSFLYGRILFQRKQIILSRCQESRGWGIVSFCMPGGGEIEHQLKKKSKIPGGVPGRDNNSKN